MGLTPYAVARALGMPRTRVECLARRETALTADTALRLAGFFGVTPAFWTQIQAEYDLERAQDAAAQDIARISPHRHQAV
jgi:antitoxin HigA-1